MLKIGADLTRASLLDYVVKASLHASFMHMTDFDCFS